MQPCSDTLLRFMNFRDHPLLPINHGRFLRHPLQKKFLNELRTFSHLLRIKSRDYDVLKLSRQNALGLSQPFSATGTWESHTSLNSVILAAISLEWNLNLSLFRSSQSNDKYWTLPDSDPFLKLSSLVYTTGIFNLVRGSFPTSRVSLSHPFFIKQFKSRKHFHLFFIRSTIHKLYCSLGQSDALFS